MSLCLSGFKSFRDVENHLYLFVILPSCGLFRDCRAKHQKLKTGNDQSPGDKKPETEAEQRMLKQLVLFCRVRHNMTSTLSNSRF